MRMKTKTEIEIKKVRKELRKFPITEEEKATLREKLAALKKIVKKEKQELVENI